MHEIRPGDCVIQRADEHGAHADRRPRRSGLPRLRNELPDRVRLAAALERGAHRLAVGGGPDGRPVGHRGAAAAARLRRSRAAATEHRQRRRGRARAPKDVRDRAARDERALRPGRPPLGAPRSRARTARCRTAIRRTRRSSSSSKATARSSCGPSPVPLSQGVEREDIPIRAGHVIARPPMTRIAHAFLAGAERDDDAHLRDEAPERHGVVPAVEQDLLARARRDRPHRSARLLGRRACATSAGSARSRRAGRARRARRAAGAGGSRARSRRRHHEHLVEEARDDAARAALPRAQLVDLRAVQRVGEVALRVLLESASSSVGAASVAPCRRGDARGRRPSCTASNSACAPPRAAPARGARPRRGRLRRTRARRGRTPPARRGGPRAAPRRTPARRPSSSRSHCDVAFESRAG